MSETLKHLQEKYNKLGLSRTELAEEFGISLATLDRMLANGDSLPKYKKLGRQYLFLLADIASFFENKSDAEAKRKKEPG